MPRLFFLHLLRRRRPWLAAGAVLLVLAAWWARGHFRSGNPLLETPALLLESVQAKALYFNVTARGWLLARRPDLLVPEDFDAGSARSRAFAQAVLEPNLFRQLDRQYRFDALLFAGDPSQYRTLLDHLTATKDWSLSYVDNWGMVFRRAGGPAWKMEDLTPVRARFARAGARDRALFLAQTGMKLVAVQEFAAGRQLLDEAAQLDDQLPEVWNGLAGYHLQRGEYTEAFAKNGRALELDKEHLPALATKTQLLYGTKHFTEAYEISRQLIERLPEDPSRLFYHAKIAHEAHAYQAEVEALEKLIARAETADRPVSGYQIYLGQAYAAMSDGPRAVDAFMRVLDDPELPQEQRDFARASIARIKKRTGL